MVNNSPTCLFYPFLYLNLVIFKYYYVKLLENPGIKNYILLETPVVSSDELLESLEKFLKNGIKKNP